MATDYSGLSNGLGKLLQFFVQRPQLEQEAAAEAAKASLDQDFLRARLNHENAQTNRLNYQTSSEQAAAIDYGSRRKTALRGLVADALSGDASRDAVLAAYDQGGDALALAPMPLRGAVAKALRYGRVLDLAKDGANPNEVAKALREVQDAQDGTFKVADGMRINEVTGAMTPTVIGQSEVNLNGARAGAATLSAKSGAVADYARANASNASAAYFNARRENPERYRAADGGIGWPLLSGLAQRDYDREYPKDEVTGQRPTGAPMPSEYVVPRVQALRAQTRGQPAVAPTSPAMSGVPVPSFGVGWMPKGNQPSERPYQVMTDKKGRKAKVFEDGTYEVLR